MRLRIMAATTANKAINKARLTGKLSLVAVAKLNLLQYYVKFSEKELKLGDENYRSKHKELIDKFNKLANSCPDIICNIREADCSSGEYESTSIIRNPYKPVPPPTVEPEPTPTNEPAAVTDNSIVVENNVTTTLTLSMFTSVYTDPENDLLDAIRIDKIHSTNLGIFYIDGIEVSVGQIITREQLELGALTHIGANTETVNTDSFDFSARDEGSQVWVN